MKYLATYDLPGITDLLAFNTRAARDAWVNFLDDLSRATKTTADNCTFGRKAIDASEDILIAKSIIRHCKHTEKIPNAIVYCASVEVLV